MSDMVTVPMTAQRDIQTVTTEIRTIYEAGVQIELAYAVEIGRRLTEAKEMLPHGEWGEWIKEELPFGRSKAQYLMRIFEAYGDDQTSLFGGVKYQALGNLTATQALLLLDVPEAEREDFAEKNHVEDMSTRELQKLIRERDEAKDEAAEKAKEAEAAKKEAAEWKKKGLNTAADSAAEISELKKKLKEAEEDAALHANKIERLEAAREQARAQLEEIKAASGQVPEELVAKIKSDAIKEAQKAARESEAEKAQKRLDAAEDARAAAEAARQAAEDEAEQLRKQLATADPATAVFRERFSAVQEDFEMLRKVWETMEDSDKRQKLTQAVQAVLAQQGELWG